MYGEADDATLDGILARRLSGKRRCRDEIAQFKTGVLLYLAAEYQLVDGYSSITLARCAITTPVMFQLIGADVGFDSINDQPLAEPLSQLLGAQGRAGGLPKTILYCLNPRDNEVHRHHGRKFPGRRDARARCSSVPAGGLTTRKMACSAR